MKTILYYLLFSLIFSIILTNDEKLISTRYYSDNLSFETSLQIGTPLHLNYYLIDIVSSYTWMINYLHPNNEKSSTYKPIKESVIFKIDKYNMKGKEIEDTVVFGNKQINAIPSFSFFLVKDYGDFIPTRISGIAFAFKFNDTKYSIMHQLKNNNFIDHLSFSLIRGNNNKGMMYLGGIPHQDVMNKTHAMCTVKGINNLWDCTLSKITIGKNTYINTLHMYFDTVTSVILAPKTFISFLLDFYFDNGIRNDHCQLLFSRKEKKQMKCTKNYINTLPNIIWVIDNYAIQFNSTILFDCNEDNDNCYFYIALNNLNDEFVLGKEFLRHFDLFFDYEKEQIHLYSNDIPIHYYSSNKFDNVCNSKLKYIIILMIIITAIMILGIGLIEIQLYIHKIN